MIWRIFAVFVLVLIWAPLTVNAQAEAGATVTAPGIHQLTFTDGRRYTLAIPDGYTPQEPVPLILSLHYGGTVTPFYGRGLVEGLIGPAFRSLSAIIVAPDSAAGDWVNPTADQHVIELIDYIEANYSIDTSRTLVTGYSMGGGGTWYLAPRHPDRFRAAIVMAGRPQADSTSLEWQTPLYVIHSTADQVVPFASTEATVDDLRLQGAPVTLVVVDGISHYEIPRYRPFLEAALPWIEEAWAQ